LSILHFHVRLVLSYLLRWLKTEFNSVHKYTACVNVHTCTYLYKDLIHVTEMFY